MVGLSEARPDADNAKPKSLTSKRPRGSNPGPKPRTAQNYAKPRKPAGEASCYGAPPLTFGYFLSFLSTA